MVRHLVSLTRAVDHHHQPTYPRTKGVRDANTETLRTLGERYSKPAKTCGEGTQAQTA